MNFDLGLALSWYIALIVAMVLHEAAHAWVAYLGGDRTAYEGGQVTLNPIPHMQREPFGTIFLPILTLFWMGFPLGFAHAPYNPYWADAHPKRAALMAAAGPLSNLLLALLVFGLIKLGLSLDWFEYAQSFGTGRGRDGLIQIAWLTGHEGVDTGLVGAIAQILPIFLFMNLLLFAFNLIPVPPLDGAGVAEGSLPGSAGAIFGEMRRSGTMALVGLMIAWYFFPRLWWPLYGAVEAWI